MVEIGPQLLHPGQAIADCLGEFVSVVKMAFPGAQVSRVGPKYNRIPNRGARKTMGALNDDLTVPYRSGNTCCLCVA